MASRRLLFLVRHEDGFTLLEQVVTLGIMTVALLGLAGMMASVISANGMSQKQATAITLAEDKIDEMRRAGYDAALFVNRTQTEPYSTIAGYPLFKRVTLTEVNTPVESMQTITVTVYWDSDLHSIQRNTQVSE